MGRKAGRVETKITGAIASVASKYYLRKPDLRELLEIKFPTVDSVAYAALNELRFRSGSEKGGKLTSVNLELTNHCNLYCTICPVNTTMKRPKNFMDPELFRKVIDENPQFEFALTFQWGEPLLHPQVFELVRYARDQGVRPMLTSNGTHLSDEKRKQLLECGLERITFSVDGDRESHERIRGYSWDQLREDIVKLREERDAVGSTMCIDVSMVVDETTESALESYYKDWRGVVDRVQAIPKFTPSERKTPCRELWRGTAVVLWDGRVSVCCADSEGTAIIGDAWEQPLEEIWNGPEMREFRRAHLEGRFPKICAFCGEFDHPLVSKRFS
ncbi:MAG: radical SAM/SPASM domain-containing protein [Planctomycetota bacterium]|jgi:MoaA/NifB/PqqE/SkfB family radical SAM enzyme